MSKKRNKNRKSKTVVLYKAYFVMLNDESIHILIGTDKQIHAQKNLLIQDGYKYMQLIGCNIDYTRLKNFVSEWTLDTNNPIIKHRQIVAV